MIMSNETITPTLMRRVKHVLLVVLIVLAASLLLIAGCQSKVIYMPHAYPPGTSENWQRTGLGNLVDFKTSQGNQRAFLQGDLKSPRNLWIVCCGNGSVVLDWSNWLAMHGPSGQAWLLVDLPGYGDCEGKPSPEHIRETFQAALPVAFRELGWPASPDPQRLRFFGHSLGSAACLIAASEFKIQRGVLLAPFTSTMGMAQRITGMPLGFLITHRYDNEARLAELAARGVGEVVILHGTDDEVIPITMSRSLVAQQPKIVKLVEIKGGHHNDIQGNHAETLAEALARAGG